MINHNVLKSRTCFTLWAGAIAAVMVMTAAPMSRISAEEHLDKDPVLMSGHMDPSEMSMTGDVDYDFAVNMRLHHQMGVEMAQAEVDHGTDPEMVKLAKNIITAQTEEISTLDKWIATHQPRQQAPAKSQ